MRRGFVFFSHPPPTPTRMGNLVRVESAFRNDVVRLLFVPSFASKEESGTDRLSLLIPKEEIVLFWLVDSLSPRGVV